LEILSSIAADALLVVDDYVPHGSDESAGRLRASAKRLFRAQGNRSGRLRLNPDATMRGVRTPRGMILSTGEDLPTGQSILAQMLCISVAPGDVDLPALTASPSDAAKGLLAGALSGYVKWTAERRKEVLDQLREDRNRLRAEDQRSGRHGRTTEIIAGLAAGFRLALQFMTDAAALDAEERQRLEQETWATLMETGDVQMEAPREEEPAGRCLALLSSALASGAAHVVSPEGDGPSDWPVRWSWRTTEKGMLPNWRSMGRCVGWIEGSDLYVDPAVSFAVAQQLAKETGVPFAIMPVTLWRRLAEKGFLLSRDSTRQRNTLGRRGLGGARREVLHLDTKALDAGGRDGGDGFEVALSPPSPPATLPHARSSWRRPGRCRPQSLGSSWWQGNSAPVASVIGRGPEVPPTVGPDNDPDKNPGSKRTVP
jgi:hypothetical protein